MLDKIKDMWKKSPEGMQKIPFHIAITTHGTPVWSKQNNLPIDEAYKKTFEVIESIIDAQIQNKVRIVSFYILPEKKESSEIFDPIIDGLVVFFNKLASKQNIHTNQVKISIFGKWYDLPGRVIEPIKKMIDETKDYDNFFLNFCVNYNGQEEIIDACKLIARQVKADRLDPDMITKEMIKESIYTSYFLPPDIVIKNGFGKSLNAFLLWDSSYSEIQFTNKLFPQFTPKDFNESIEKWKSGR